MKCIISCIGSRKQNCGFFLPIDIEEIVASLAWCYDLKEKQLMTLKHLLQGKYVFCELATGYGNSEALGLLPVLKDKVFSNIYILSKVSVVIINHTTMHAFCFSMMCICHV